MTDVPDSIGGNPILAIDSQVLGVLDVSYDDDWYQVTVTAGQRYFVNLTANGANFAGVADTYLEIFDVNGSAIGVADDDDGAGSNSFIDWVPTVSGTYYLSAEAFGNETGDYLLSIFQDVPKSTATAATLPINSVLDTDTTTVTGFISDEPDFDEDWYAVTLIAGHNYRFDISGNDDPGAALTNANVRLLDSTGAVIKSLDGVLYYTATTTGTYYVSAGALNATDTGYYSLGVTDTSTLPGSPTTTPLGAIDWTSWVVPHAPSMTTEIKVFFAEDGAAIQDRYYDSNANTVTDSDPFTALGWQQDQYDAALAVFAQYESVANVHFTVVTDIDEADFVMARTYDTVGDFGGYWDVGGNSQGAGAYLTYDGVPHNVLGVGVFNATEDGEGYNRGDYGFHLLLHELGHGMGLAHPHDIGGGSEIMHGVFSSGDYGEHDLNQTINTVMSYNRGWYTQSNVPNGGYEASLMAFDIAKLQEKYGAVANATGNDTYTLLDGDNFYASIWDTGGTDEIVFAGSVSTVIDLRAANLEYSSLGGGAVSYVYGVKGGFTVAHGVVIENATGGSGADTLRGNEAANRLDGGASADNMAGGDGSDTVIGGGGNDTVDGGTGNDTAVFTHGWVHYAIGAAGDVYSLVDDSSSDSDGTDTLSSIETFIFAGQSVGAAAALNLAPVINGNSLAAGLRVGAATTATGSLLTNASDENAALGDTLAISQARSDTLGSSFIAIAGAVQLVGQYGTLSLSANGAYSYALDGSDADTAALVDGMSAHDVFSFTVRDVKGLAASAQLDVAIEGAANRAPVITSNGGGPTATISVGETFAGVTMVTSTDAEGTPRTYSLSGADAAKFVLNPTTGILNFLFATDFEAPVDIGANNVYDIVVTASDGSLSDTQAIAVTVSNVMGVSITGDGGNNTINPSRAFAGKVPGSEEDWIDGKGGDDKLNGFAGNDTLIGGKGNDILNGAVGYDTFVFNAKLGSGNVDKVKDFGHDIDIFALDDKIFSKIGASLSKKEFYAAAGAAKAHDRDDRIVYDSKSGKLYYDDDGNKLGGHAAVQFAVLSTKPGLDHGDFVIV